VPAKGIGGPRVLDDCGHELAQLVSLQLAFAIRVRNDLLQLGVEQDTLLELQVEHLLAHRRRRDTEPGDQAEKCETHIGGSAARSVEVWGHTKCRTCLENAIAEVHGIALPGSGEEGVSYRLDAPPVPRKPLLVVLEPQGCSRGDLRCGC
jgi:hypothetical protein